MPPELPETNPIVVNPDGTFQLHYTTTAGTFANAIQPLTLENAITADNHNDFQVNAADFYNYTLTIDPAEMNTIHTSDCSGNAWITLNEERIKEIVRETVKELLEQEGYIVGKIPNQPSDLPVGE